MPSVTDNPTDGSEAQLFTFEQVGDTTWALRRSVLLKMHMHGLAKTLQMRSLVGTAAMRIQEQITIADAA